MLLFSKEKTEFPFFEFPYFRVLPHVRPQRQQRDSHGPLSALRAAARPKNVNSQIGSSWPVNNLFLYKTSVYTRTKQKCYHSYFGERAVAPKIPCKCLYTSVQDFSKINWNTLIISQMNVDVNDLHWYDSTTNKGAYQHRSHMNEQEAIVLTFATR